MQQTAILYVSKNTSQKTLEYIKDQFQIRYGHTLSFHVAESPALLVGFLAIVNVQIYNASLSTKLQDLKKHLLEE